MPRFSLETLTLIRDAERCERLCAAAYNPALSSQLLTLAQEFRLKAARLENRRAA